jgi:arabinan endo-1,5-alpha-L-arabinosidase
MAGRGTTLKRLSLIAPVLVVGVAAVAFMARSDSPSYQNPVLNHDAPDPSVIRGGDGFYYAYTTQSDWPTLEYMPVLKSPDLINWRHVGDALPELPAWATHDVWAPHVMRVGKVYNAYFSVRQYGRAGFAIGVAVSDSPTGPFRGEPKPLLRGPRFTTIDPFVMRAQDGHLYIYWGSNSAPIRVQRLSSNGRRVVGRARPVLYPSERGYERLVEGAWVVYRGDFYYLMYSGDACCEPDPHYAVMVARSRSPLGPFHKFAGNPILEANERFLAPGHNATIRDEEGRDWILYHAFERRDITGIRKLLIDPITWKEGWPEINGGGGPSGEPREAPVVEP